MKQPIALPPPQPVIVAELFPEILDELLSLLAGLTPAEWDAPTVCPGWSVKDVALHLLGGEIGNLARRRDGHALGSSIASWEELVTFINRWNENWVQTARRMSPRLLMDLLHFTGRQVCDYFRSLDPYALGGAVSWAGPQPAPVWLDLAREYTERWHHQQHIRDAVGKPGLKQTRYLAPVLATFVWALPRAFRSTQAAEGTVVTLRIAGDSGGQWSLVREGEEWRLYAGAVERPEAEVVVMEDIAWRLFTRGLPREEVLQHMVLHGDQGLGLGVLEAVSIIA